jgi:acetyl-CoA carboxylase biotin carboxyl carrier protein
MDLSLLRKLVRLMGGADLTELEVEDKESGLRVRLKRGVDVAPTPAPVVHVSQGTSAPAPPATAAPESLAAAEAPAPAAPTGQPFPSPMVGTFYRATSPDADPFVEVGARVEPDTVLCIVEAMKVMNEIKAETRGEIAEILAENGEPVEFGQPLFLIRSL